MAGLSDFKIKSLKPVEGKRLEVADEHGLYLEVLPSGSKVWRYRYALHGKREKVTIGPYPEFGVADARKQRLLFSEMVAKGQSPAKAKQRELSANAKANSVRELGELYIAEIVNVQFKRPLDTERYFHRDIFPILGHYKLHEVTPQDVLRMLDAVKARGKRKAVEGEKAGKNFAKASGVHAAKATRTIIKRLFDFAIARQLITYNPVSVIPRGIIAQPTKRDRALSEDELKQFARNLQSVDDTQAFKVALRIILLTLVRKGELVKAKWKHVNFDKAEWRLPTSKNSEPHLIPLATQTIELFKELKNLAGESEWVLPGRSGNKSISEHTLNVMWIRNKAFGLENFVIHDMRRTASTLLHEMGYIPDVIEKALNHTIGGIRGVYNVAKYADQRREMLQHWANHIDSLCQEG
ncbi:MAG: tyrosine-type recombinase/integrase [Gallionella sp.]|nr:tyrosine-type recombinase/integrase [Gallionella sp.]